MSKQNLGPYSDNSTFRQTFKSCREAFSRGGVVPEFGKPVTIVLTDNSTVACSAENVRNGSTSCPVGWFGSADDNFCFKIRTDVKTTNEEACR